METERRTAALPPACHPAGRLRDMHVLSAIPPAAAAGRRIRSASKALLGHAHSTCVCVCVRACVRVRVCARARVCRCACVRACTRARARARASFAMCHLRAHTHMLACVYACLRAVGRIPRTRNRARAGRDSENREGPGSAGGHAPGDGRAAAAWAVFLFSAPRGSETRTGNATRKCDSEMRSDPGPRGLPWMAEQKNEGEEEKMRGREKEGGREGG